MKGNGERWLRWIGRADAGASRSSRRSGLGGPEHLGSCVAPWRRVLLPTPCSCWRMLLAMSIVHGWLPVSAPRTKPAAGLVPHSYDSRMSGCLLAGVARADIAVATLDGEPS